jgi:probable rRNA maturation factor
VPDVGELEVFVADEQREQPVDVVRWAALARGVIEAEGIRGDAELSLLFVSEATMTELNERFMDATGPTDVLSFPIDEDVAELPRWPEPSTTGPDRGPSDPSDAPLLLGDVVVCPEVAARNAPDHAGTYDDELALLVVHGVLHVLGMDHDTPDEAARMRAREDELLARFHRRLAVGTEMPGDR